jgi:hypothetical protein
MPKYGSLQINNSLTLILTPHKTSEVEGELSNLGITSNMMLSHTPILWVSNVAVESVILFTSSDIIGVGEPFLKPLFNGAVWFG